VGTMIEIPRAALVADQIARDAEFFSFGTNDLTQTALGMSRDDSGSFLPAYAELDIVDTNPFATIDQKGVGRLMEITRDLGRKTRPNIKLGICGEHGGEPTSVKFCHWLGLDYVSCSPFRIPIARLAAAQAALASYRVVTCQEIEAARGRCASVGLEETQVWRLRSWYVMWDCDIVTRSVLRPDRS